MALDGKILSDQARAKLPLDVLMTQHGDGPAGGGGWKSFRCPWCQKKSAGVRGTGGRLWFKCFHTACPSGTSGEKGAIDEAGYVALKTSQPRGAAWVTWLKMAGVWEERERVAPSVMPGKSGRKWAAPEPPPAEGAQEPDGIWEEATERPPGEAPLSPAGNEFAGTGLSNEPEPRGAAMVVDVPGEPEGDCLRLLTAGSAGGNAAPTEPAMERSPEEASQGSLSGDERRGESGGSPSACSGGNDFSVLPGTPTGNSMNDGPAVPTTPNDVSASPGAAVGDSGLAPGGAPNFAGKGERVLTADFADGTDGKRQGGEPGGGTRPTRGSGGGSGGDDGDLPPPGSGGGGSGDGEDEEEESLALRALREFYGRLSLSEEDRERLWVERGLCAATVEAAGIVGNPRSNLAILDEMAARYDEATLVEAGLYASPKEEEQFGGGGAKAKPNTQFYGYGLKGKRRAAGGKSEMEWGWTHPVLIPYWGERGELTMLRPHKGMARGGIPQVFFAREKGVGEKGKAEVARTVDAVVTEGEFKALALWQTLGSPHGKLKALPIRVCAIPGISQIKNWFVQTELLDWLTDLLARRVVSGFDSEEKGDPKLPSYKEDPRDRHDTEAYARYLAMWAGENNFQGLVCRLPREWRDNKGKADWDGVLGWFCREWGKEGEPGGGTRPATGGAVKPTAELSNEIWLRVHGRAREEFLRVIRGAEAPPRHGQAHFWEGAEERIIAERLARIARDPELPYGGEKEEGIANRLMGYVRDIKGLVAEGVIRPRHVGFVLEVAKAYRGLRGRYYIHKALSEVPAKEWSDIRAKAWGDRERKAMKKLAWVAEVMLQGPPKWVSNFFMRVEFVLSKLDGTRARMVTLHNIHGESTGLRAMGASDSNTTSKWREWLPNQGNMSWAVGEQPLQLLMLDWDAEAVGKEVQQVGRFGWHEETGLWFFKDVAFAPGRGKETAREIRPDGRGIFWHLGKGYSFVRHNEIGTLDVEGQAFHQGEPTMHPERTVAAELGVKAGEETAGLRSFFEEMAERFCDTLGGYEGFLVLGSVLAYGAGPEVFAHYTQFPGLWLHGEMQQGKSAVARWLLRIWGFTREGGMPLKGSTRVGVSVAMQQYSNLPFWLEEFQPDSPVEIVEVVKNLFGRESGGKWIREGAQRKIVGNAIITGVAMCAESQVRSRFAHAQVSQSRRRKEQFDWMVENSRKFYLIGRHVLRRRAEFAETVANTLKHWMEMPSMKGVESRAKLVHGVAWAGFTAMASLLESEKLAGETKGFMEFLKGHCAQAATEVKKEVSIEQFWTHLVSCHQQGVFGQTVPELRQFFYVKRQSQEHAPAAENQPGWASYELYFLPNPILDLIRAHLRKQGKGFPLERADVQGQMATRPYWIESPGHKRFGGSTQRCWGVSLDRFPELGYTKVSDEDYLAWKERSLGPEAHDPRKGALFGLAEFLTRAQTEGLGE